MTTTIPEPSTPQSNSNDDAHTIKIVVSALIFVFILYPAVLIFLYKNVSQDLVKQIVEFCLPLLAPLGLLIMSATIESVTKYGQQLSAEQGVALTAMSGWGKMALHMTRVTHHLYLACFSFSLTCVVQLSEPWITSLSYHQKPHTLTIAAIVVSILGNCLAYFHTVFTLARAEREERGRRAEDNGSNVTSPQPVGSGQRRQTKPITLLHIFYAPTAILSIIAIRW